MRVTEIELGLIRVQGFAAGFMDLVMALLIEALKHGMSMQRELSVTFRQVQNFQGCSYYHCYKSMFLGAAVYLFFPSCSVLDIKCSLVEPIFVSAAASKGHGTSYVDSLGFA
ncbi:hypothetical protein RchiOBHm_Chr4g0404071 [Rosa chinensis]|uniref:Uncharacterized protein n=1 Tax=Rosa chinensis TaxID=74649 RepID=A0A2P6QTV9_ROSCH|nr:hypothetical protein RchiOBHm_Chr4g0404071 [Rosa chinensis]